MRKTILVAIITTALAAPAPAVEFLGVDLCGDPVSTAIVLPDGSPLVVKSVEAGAQGGLVILFSTDEGDPLHTVDALMEAELGRSGSGDETSLTWTGPDVIAYAQPISQTYVALAIRGGTDCSGGAKAAQQPSPPSASEPPEPPATETASSPADAAPSAAAPAPSSSPATPPPADVKLLPPTPAGITPAPPAPPETDFELLGDLQHEAAADDWVDVMGVVANNTADGYRLATFDVSLYDAAGELICVDTISVSVLKPGQERAFRDSIRCPGYDPAAVATWKLQFAGGV
jgi:hypothetical protein